ncbi:MAG: SirB2 family protein [Gammaproteobacteria bacterium]|jgi:uncharacterized membrane protein SirB2
MLKTLHVATVVISLALFVGRGSWFYIFGKQLTSRWLKIIPHVNDTFLLVTGITLAVRIQQYPFAHSWLTVKLICLVIYIVLGMLAMKWHKGTRAGLYCWVGAILVFLYMISVALSKNPLPLALN